MEQVNGNINLAEGEAKATAGTISLDNSLDLGVSGKVGPVNLEGNINLFHVGTSIGYLIEAGAEYIKGTINDMMHPENNIPDPKK